MFIVNSLRRIMAARAPGLLVMSIALALPTLADTRIPISSVRPEYSPMAGPQRAEPVSMQGYSFEIERETGRARVVIEYAYPNQPAFGTDGGAGPAPTMARIAGLRYDAISKTVVFDNGGRSVICAKVSDRKVLFWNTSSIVPTGACKVTAAVVSRREDTGWNIQHVRTLDTFFAID